MNEQTSKELQRRRAILPKRYPLPVRIALGILEAILYLGVIAIALGIVGLLIAGMAWLIVTVAI